MSSFDKSVVCQDFREYICYMFKTGPLEKYVDQFEELVIGTDFETDLEFEKNYCLIIKQLSSEYKNANVDNQKTILMFLGWMSLYINNIFLLNIDRYMMSHSDILGDVPKEKLLRSTHDQIKLAEKLVDHHVWKDFKKRLSN